MMHMNNKFGLATPVMENNFEESPKNTKKNNILGRMFNKMQEGKQQESRRTSIRKGLEFDFNSSNKDVINPILMKNSSENTNFRGSQGHNITPETYSINVNEQNKVGIKI